jgi:hypothetical protein
MNASNINMEQEQKPLPKIVGVLGVKPASSKTLGLLRIIVAVTILGLCIWAVLEDAQDECDVKDLEDILPTQSLFHTAIAEIPEDRYRKNCSLAFKEILNDNETKKEKLYKSIKIALLASISSEFIINGNLDKPVSVIGKTLSFALINTLLTF